ncbi:MAG: ABC transporter substrate-binding protein [Acidimicrobiales bacterium]
MIPIVAAGAMVLGAWGGMSGSRSANTAKPATARLKPAYGTLPPQSGKPKNGGTVTIAENPGAGPNWIFPVTPAANSSVYTISNFQNFSWRPLYWAPKGESPAIDYSQSMAGPPKYADANKIVTMHINPGWKWSNGKPVTAKDLEFFVWMLKAAVKISPANFGNYTPGLMPDNVASMSAPNASTLVIRFKRTYNQNFLLLGGQLGVLTPLPSAAWSKTSLNGRIIPFNNMANAEAIYKFLAAESGKLSTYGSDPLWKVVDGPYVIKSFDPATDANTFVANARYGGPGKPHIKTLKEVAFTSVSAEFNQLLSKNIDFGGVDFSDLAQVPHLKSLGYNVWGAPDFGFNYVVYNFKDGTGSFSRIINQLYFRQVLAHLQNEQAVIKSRGIFDGAADQAYGPVPSVPPSPFTPVNAKKNPYPFSISKAKSMLKSHGWHVVPGGKTTCAKPGPGNGECGAGIKRGTALTWNLIYSNSPAVIGQQDEAWASNAKKVGITINLSSKTFNYIISSLSDVSSPSTKNTWAMSDFGGFTGFVYPTMNEIFNTTGSYNFGGFSNPQVNADITASADSLNSSAVEKELALETERQPGLFQPAADIISAWKKSLSGPQFSFSSSSQYVLEPNYWYFKK